MAKTAGWYLMHEGRKLLAATKAEAHQLAQFVADKTGKPVTVRPVKAAAKKAAAPAARAKPARRTMRRNPDPLAYLAAWREDQRGREARKDYVAATKGRRLAKGLRGRDRGGAVKAAERGAAKTGKFAVDVRGSLNGVKQSFTLFRASRSAAQALVDQMAAAGYKVALREV